MIGQRSETHTPFLAVEVPHPSFHQRQGSPFAALRWEAGRRSRRSIAGGNTDSHAVAKQPCGSHPSWYPLDFGGVKGYDEEGRFRFSADDTSFPLATQRVPLATLSPGHTARFGVIHFELTRGIWVMATMRAAGRFGTAFNGQPLNSACDRGE
jgi:hypothetical protein